jgi:hypothetical protein
VNLIALLLASHVFGAPSSEPVLIPPMVIEAPLPDGCVLIRHDAGHTTTADALTWLPGAQFYGPEGTWWAADGSLIGWAVEEDAAVYNVRGCGPAYE